LVALHSFSKWNYRRATSPFIFNGGLFNLEGCGRLSDCEELVGLLTGDDGVGFD